MTFNINEVLAEMAGAVKNEVKDDWQSVKITFGNFLQSRKDRLNLLADFRMQGEISEDFFQQRLADEKDIIESELHAIAVINKVAAQNAANAAIAILQKSVEGAVGLI
ncbi:MAG: hypothetical protein ABIO55_08295 [Ginsengibacter sp.]